MMKIKVEFNIKCFTKEDLFKTYKPEETYKGCQRCSNYRLNHTCPDLTYDAATYLKEYTHVIFALAEIRTEAIQDTLQYWHVSDFPSRVMTNHLKRLEDKSLPLTSAVSMYLFNQVKDIMTERLLQMEADLDVLGLPPGSCTRCQDCLKAIGHPCIAPDKIRHSIEALGFLVSDIYRTFYNKQLGWTRGKLSEIIHSCNVIFSKEPLSIDAIIPYLQDVVLTLPDVRQESLESDSH